MEDKYPRIANDGSQLEMFKNDVVKEINDIEESQGGSVEIAGTSLVIPEQPAPEPVITIDGVAYYHDGSKDMKAEFDALEVFHYAAFSIVNLNKIDDRNTYTKCYVYTERNSSGDYPFSVKIRCLDGDISLDVAGTEVIGFSELQNGISIPNEVYKRGPSTPYNLYDNLDTDDVTALYLKIDENGVLYCYYNLKNEGPEFVDSVKQGNAVIPMKDDRLPAAEAADAGKVLKVADAGGYELGEAGGTKLYQHELTMAISGGDSVTFYVVSPKAEPITNFNDSSFNAFMRDAISIHKQRNGLLCAVSCIFQGSRNSVNFAEYNTSSNAIVVTNYNTATYSVQSDTVTAL